MHGWTTAVVKDRVLQINIYGEIYEDYVAHYLSGGLINECDSVEVRISSPGGCVGDGITIYNALKACGKPVRTIVDGFACSIASVIFMAGDERIMTDTSLLMIHNVSAASFGTATEHRKLADDIDTVNERSKAAYMERVNISREELSEMMDAETWISAEDAFSMGFATQMEAELQEGFGQSASRAIRDAIMAGFEQACKKRRKKQEDHEDDPEKPEEEPMEPDEDPEDPEYAPESPDEDPEGDPEDPEKPEEDPEDDPESKCKKDKKKQKTNAEMFAALLDKLAE